MFCLSRRSVDSIFDYLTRKNKLKIYGNNEKIFHLLKQIQFSNKKIYINIAIFICYFTNVIPI